MSLLHARLNPPLAHWQGKCAWIVGASSGIGRATAEALHAQGARVIVSARDAAALHALIQGRSGFLALPLDVTQPETMAAATGTVKAYAGAAPDLLLYCAGRYRPQRATAFDLLEMQGHGWRHQRRSRGA